MGFNDPAEMEVCWIPIGHVCRSSEHPLKIHGKHKKINHGTSAFLIGISTISMVIFHSFNGWFSRFAVFTLGYLSDVSSEPDFQLIFRHFWWFAIEKTWGFSIVIGAPVLRAQSIPSVSPLAGRLAGLVVFQKNHLYIYVYIYIYMYIHINQK